jgi:hypothetical protein
MRSDMPIAPAEERKKAGHGPSEVTGGHSPTWPPSLGEEARETPGGRAAQKTLRSRGKPDTPE